MSATSIHGVVVAAVVAVAGCAAGTEPSSRAATSTASASLEIPPVDRPLEVSAFVADACALLDDAQRRELGLPAAKKVERRGNACDLHADPAREDPSNYLRLVLLGDAGLADQYAQCDTVDCARWTTDDVDGYPVIRATDELISKYGSCKLFLGVADDVTVLVVDVVLDSSADGPDCDRADRAASMVLATLG